MKHPIAITYEYDGIGNVIRGIDSQGNVTQNEYDESGCLIRGTDALGNTTSYTYNYLGKEASVTNALGETITYEYDALGRKTCENYPDGTSTAYFYDTLGRCMTYDAIANVISMTDAEGVVTQRATYDAMGRTASVTDALGVETHYKYDAMGNVLEAVKQLNGGSRTTSYTYDELGRVTSVTDPLAGVTKASYDRRGNLTSVTDANGGVTKYSYDSMGQMIESVSPLGNRYSYSYDAGGLLTGFENARGQATSYTYDKAGRVTAMKDELGTVTYTYDPNGNVLTVTDEEGTISRKYDALNRVTEYTDYKGDTVKYAYDEIGNLIALTYPGGEIVRYTYYKNGWLHTVTDARGYETKYSYDARGNLTHTERPNGTEEICTYNEAGLLVSQKDICGEEVLTEYTYTYDENGNVTTVEGTETTETEEGISRLSSAEMAYDAENRLIRFNGETVQYDADGNMTYGPVNGVMTELVYDCRNRLISAGGITYTYDAENNRIAMETDGYREEYVTDTVSSSLSRVLVSTRKEKDSVRAAESTLYIYGNGLVYEYTGDIILYHHYNNLGSTMMLTGVGGMVVAKYTYGVYGELLSGDTSLTRFLYNGRCGVTTDDNGLYYMRQRYYNPEIKRFVNQDILTGSVDNSQSLNRYSYVQGNPVSYTDPFGLSPLNGLFTGTGFAHGLFGLLGCVPGPVGVVANIADAIVYALVDHDYFMAGVSVASALTLGAGGIAKWAAQSAKYAKLSKSCKYIETIGTLVSNGLEFFQNGVQAVDVGSDMWEKYVVNGQAFDENTVGEFLSLGLSTVACFWSGMDMTGNSKKLAKMLQEDGITDKIKQDIISFANDNRGCVDLDAIRETFTGKSSSSSEVFYRTMSQADYDYLRMTGELPATGETFISPTKSFSSDYDGVMVRFELNGGTTSALEKVGLSNGDRAKLAREVYPDMPYVSGVKWTEDYAFFKAEGDQINIGLGKGKALEIFNSNISIFEKVDY